MGGLAITSIPRPGTRLPSPDPRGVPGSGNAQHVGGYWAIIAGPPASIRSSDEPCSHDDRGLGDDEIEFRVLVSEEVH